MSCKAVRVLYLRSVGLIYVIAFASLYAQLPGADLDVSMIMQVSYRQWTANCPCTALGLSLLWHSIDSMFK